MTRYGTPERVEWCRTCTMHPLTVPWSPMIWTDVGRRNYDRWAR